MRRALSSVNYDGSHRDGRVMPLNLSVALVFFALVLAVCGGDSMATDASGAVSATGSTSSAKTTGATSGEPTTTAPTSDTCADHGCSGCRSGEFRCLDQTLQSCEEPGGWHDVVHCDPLLGLVCDPRGFCAGPCVDAFGSTGCDYRAVSTIQDNGAFLDNTFAVVVANPGTQVAVATVTFDGDVIATANVAPGEVEAVPLPRISSLTDVTDSALVVDGSYRIRATAPVDVYQFNTLKAGITNDASMLIPVTAWSDRYVVAAWPHWDSYNSPSMVAVVASENDTNVTFVPPQKGIPTQPFEDLDEQGHGSVVLDAGGVFQLLSAPTGDLTGMQVLADKPIQVIAGHACTAIPLDSFACDHLEEAILPLEMLGFEYAVVPPPQFPDSGQAKPIFARVIAVEGPTTLTFDPDQQTAKSLQNTGDFAEIGPTTTGFVVKADRRILVSLYTVSEDFGAGLGDASMLLSTPATLHRREYLVYSDPTWTASFAVLTAPMGAEVVVDQALVDVIEPLGGGDLAFARVELPKTADGLHRIASDEPVGFSLYGVHSYGSYWHPGALYAGAIPK